MSQPSSQPGSQLRRLIEQARKTRNMNDIFKFESAARALPQDPQPADPLLLSLNHLATDLFETPPDPLPIEDLLTELAEIAENL